MKLTKEIIKNFPQKYPILFHVMLISITLCVVVYGVLLVIDSFTRHGEYEVVPQVEGASLQKAIEQLENKGLRWEITDSAYSDVFGPGVVLAQEPVANSKVKPQRVVYLTVNATSPRMIGVPNVVDMSLRQGMAILEGLGFKNIRVNTVSSPYKELILDVKANGKSVNMGLQLPLSAKLELSVGSGVEEIIVDSIEAESQDLLQDKETE